MSSFAALVFGGSATTGVVFHWIDKANKQDLERNPHREHRLCIDGPKSKTVTETVTDAPDKEIANHFVRTTNTQTDTKDGGKFDLVIYPPTHMLVGKLVCSLSAYHACKTTVLRSGMLIPKWAPFALLATPFIAYATSRLVKEIDEQGSTERCLD